MPNAHLHTAIEQPPLGIHVFTPDGASLSSNEVWGEIWNLKKGDSPEDTNIFEDDRLRAAGLTAYIGESITSGDLVTTPPLWYDPARTGREGDPRWLRAYIYPVKNGTGRVFQVALLLEDVTKRKQVEEELRLKNRIVAASTSALLITDPNQPDNPIVYANPAFERATGYSAEEVVGRNCRFLQGKDRDQPALEELRAAIREGRECTVVLRNYRKDGTRFYNELNIYPVHDASGRLTNFVGVQNDISERKEAEERLRESEERFRFLVQHTSDIISVIEADGTTRYQSPAIERVLGYRPEDLITENAFDYVHPDDIERVLDAFVEVLDTGGVNPPVEFRLRHADGSWRYVEVVGNNLLDDPSVGAIIANTRDVTERKRVEEALKESEERFRSLIQNASDIITLVEADGTVLYVSPAIERVLGYKPEERIGKNTFELMHPDDVERALSLVAEGLQRSGIPLSAEVRMRHRDGSWRHIEVTGTNMLDDPAVRAGVLNSRDITERKRAEEALQRSESSLAAAQEIAHVGSWEYDPDKDEVYWSDETYRIFGFAPGQFVPTREIHLEHVYPEDRGLVGRWMCGPSPDNKRSSVEYRIVRPDGTLRIVQNYYEANFDETGRLLGVTGAIQDITERKRAEEALKESEERYRQMVDHSPEIVVVHSEGKIVFVNAAGAELAGASSPAELIGKPVMDFVHPDYREIARARIAQTQENGETTDLVHEKFLGLDGREIDVEVISTPITYQGKPATQVLARDISERRKAEEALERSEERFRLLVQHASDIITILEPDGTIRYESPAIERVFGYRPEELVGNWAFDYVHPEDFERVLTVFLEGMANNVATATVEFRFRHKDGSWRYLEAIGNYRLDDPSVRGIVVNSRDITERRRTEEALRQSEERFRSAFEDAPIGVALVGLDRRYLRVNHVLCKMLGYSAEELLTKTSAEITHPEDLEISAERVRRALEEGPGSSILEKRYIHADGHVVWILSSVSLIRDSRGNPSHFVSLYQDVTERKVLEDRLEHQAFHDALTDLPNKLLFMERLGHALARTERQESKVAVLFVDLDNFKFVNDSLGHEVGDGLLMAVAGRLRGCLRPEDTIARLGGDEFTVLLEDLADESEAARVAERITEELRAPFALGGQEVFITPSIGITFGGSGQDPPDTLLREADVAMYQAKEEGKAGHRVFDPSMEAEVVKRLKLENDLRRALERDEFRVFYQPVVRLETGRIIGMEALVRWEHPERGLMTPEEFVPLAEEIGLIVPIGQRVLRAACRQAREWQERYPSDPPLIFGVNLSARQLQHPELVGDVEGALRESGLDPKRLTLEITESAVVGDEEHNIGALRRLGDLGVRFALDDFGTGYSALSYLRRLPLGLLKLDRSFVERIGKYAEDEVLVSGVIGIASGLGLYVLAEGVETPEQLARVKTLGCDLGQGYYFSKPMPSKEARELLATHDRLG